MKKSELELHKATEHLVCELNPDYKLDPDMKDTPDRIARMYSWFFRKEDVLKHFKRRFPTDNDEMVIVKNIEAIGMCPHHLLPIIYKIHIGYIPNQWAIGLSKLARIAIGLSSYPKLQENFTKEIDTIISKNLNPKGVMVVVEGLHGCMRCRGVQQCESTTITSSISGIFVHDPNAKIEFLNLIKNNL